MIILCLYNHIEERKIIEKWAATLSGFKLHFHERKCKIKGKTYVSIKNGENVIIATDPKTQYPWAPSNRKKKKYLKNMSFSIIKIKEIKEILKWKDSYKNYEMSTLDSAYSKLNPF